MGRGWEEERRQGWGWGCNGLSKLDEPDSRRRRWKTQNFNEEQMYKWEAKERLSSRAQVEFEFYSSDQGHWLTWANGIKVHGCLFHLGFATSHWTESKKSALVMLDGLVQGRLGFHTKCCSYRSISEYEANASCIRRLSWHLSKSLCHWMWFKLVFHLKRIRCLSNWLLVLGSFCAWWRVSKLESLTI